MDTMLKPAVPSYARLLCTMAVILDLSLTID